MASKLLMFLMKDQVINGTAAYMVANNFTISETIHIIRSSSEYSMIKKESIYNLTGEY